MKYQCTICGYVYDDEKENVPFDELSNDWRCPLCGELKSDFKKISDSKDDTLAKVNTEPIHYDMEKLSVGALSVVFSNLARGSEKQYKGKQEELFKKLSAYFKEIAPKTAEANEAKLSELVLANIDEGYPGLKSVAQSENDRGTQRICVWGEKVTRMVSSLLARYEKEGESFLENTEVWVCSVCGFIYVGDEAPKLCPVCKVPDWKFDKV